MIFLWITVHDLLGLLTLFLCIFLSFLRLEIGHIQLSACISLLRLIHCLCLSLTLSILFLGRSIFLAILLLGEGHSMIPYPFWMTILHLGLVVGTEGNLITNRFFDSRKSQIFIKIQKLTVGSVPVGYRPLDNINRFKKVRLDLSTFKWSIVDHQKDKLMGKGNGGVPESSGPVGHTRVVGLGPLLSTFLKKGLCGVNIFITSFEILIIHRTEVIVRMGRLLEVPC